MQWNNLPFESSVDELFVYGVVDCNDEAICGFLKAIDEYVSTSATKKK